MPGYLIDLDLQGKRAMVVGLGMVGMRKARGLVMAGAQVLAVDPEMIATVPVGVELRVEPYRPDHLDGVALAFAAATVEVNRRVVADARARGVWVNAASEPEAGDFRIPATWDDGPVALAVSTSGASPTLAATLRDRAAKALGPEAAGLARLLAELRPEVLAHVPSPQSRARLLASVATARWLDCFATRGEEATRTELRAWLGLRPEGDNRR